MAATDLSALPQGYGFATKRVALPTSAGNARAVILPKWARRLTIAFKASDDSTDAAGSVCHEGTDDATQDTDALDIGSGQGFSFAIVGGATLYLAGSASGYAHLALTRV